MYKRHALHLSALSAAAMLAVGLAGCSNDAAAPAASESDSPEPSEATAINVVASTNVWGDIASTVGGDHVEVTSIIDDPSKDPHEYEADARTQLELSEAQLVIENGGGYDDFVDTMLDAADTDAPVVNAVDVSGKTAADGEELNEHVWYDFGTVQKVADEIATQLGTIDPDNADAFTANAESLSSDIDGLIDRAADAKSANAGSVSAAITEPVPLYLLDALGIENKTPDEFSEAIEEDTDVPAQVLQETLALFSDHAVQLLVYNEQTGGPETDEILKAAEDNEVPAVGVTETLPEGENYVSWQSGYIDAITEALGN